jgi:hypothetical protein
MAGLRRIAADSQGIVLPMHDRAVFEQRSRRAAIERESPDDAVRERGVAL